MQVIDTNLNLCFEPDQLRQLDRGRISNPNQFLKFASGIHLTANFLDDERWQSAGVGDNLSLLLSVLLQEMLPRYYDVEALAAFGGVFALYVDGVDGFTVTALGGQAMVLSGLPVNEKTGEQYADCVIAPEVLMGFCRWLLLDSAANVLNASDDEDEDRVIADFELNFVGMPAGGFPRPRAHYRYDNVIMNSQTRLGDFGPYGNVSYFETMYVGDTWSYVGSSSEFTVNIKDRNSHRWGWSEMKYELYDRDLGLYSKFKNIGSWRAVGGFGEVSIQVDGKDRSAAFWHEFTVRDDRGSYPRDYRIGVVDVDMNGSGRLDETTENGKFLFFIGSKPPADTNLKIVKTNNQEFGGDFHETLGGQAVDHILNFDVNEHIKSGGSEGINFLYQDAIKGSQIKVNGSSYDFNLAPSTGDHFTWEGAKVSFTINATHASGVDGHAQAFAGDRVNERIDEANKIGAKYEQSVYIDGKKRGVVYDYMYVVTDGSNDYTVAVVDVDLGNPEYYSDFVGEEDGYLHIFADGSPAPNTSLTVKNGFVNNGNSVSHADLGAAQTNLAVDLSEHHYVNDGYRKKEFSVVDTLCGVKESSCGKNVSSHTLCGANASACGAKFAMYTACGLNASVCSANASTLSFKAIAASACAANASSLTASGLNQTVCGLKASMASFAGVANEICGAKAAIGGLCGVKAETCAAKISGASACGVQADACGARASALTACGQAGGACVAKASAVSICGSKNTACAAKADAGACAVKAVACGAALGIGCSVKTVACAIDLMPGFDVGVCAINVTPLPSC